MGKDRIRGLRVGGTELAPPAADSTDHHGDFELPAKHIMQFWGFIDDVVHCREGEVDRHQLGNGTQAGHCRADRCADDCRFSDGGIAHPLGSELVVEAAGDGIGAAPHANFFADDENIFVALHFFTQRVRDCLSYCDGSHVIPPPRKCL